jgi:hypothetical protein
MLERERHNVLDSFNRGRQRVTGKPLADDNLDASDVVSRPPMVLEQQFAAKMGEPQTLELARLRELCFTQSASPGFLS